MAAPLLSLVRHGDLALLDQLQDRLLDDSCDARLTAADTARLLRWLTEDLLYSDPHLDLEDALRSAVAEPAMYHRQYLACRLLISDLGEDVFDALAAGGAGSGGSPGGDDARSTVDDSAAGSHKEQEEGQDPDGPERDAADEKAEDAVESGGGSWGTCWELALKPLQQAGRALLAAQQVCSQAPRPPSHPPLERIFVLRFERSCKASGR